MSFPGDPTFLGWMTVLAYAAAIACGVAAVRRIRHSARPGGARKIVFWFMIIGLLAALGLNKQLDLQTLVTQVGKRLALAQGWHGQRRIVQVTAECAALAVAGAMVAALFWLAGESWREHALALVGVALLVVFAMLRIAFMLRMGDLLGLPLGAPTLKWMLELGGILCIGAAAAAAEQRSKPPRA